MRSLPHSVVVLTTSLPEVDSSGSPHEPMATTPSNYRGMTLSSFTTLTLTPSPIITFNIKNPSRTLSAISKSRNFLIHILEASENGMKIADAFTKGNADDRSLFLHENKEVFGVEEIGVGKENGAEIKMPMLKAEGVISVLRCVVLGAGEGIEKEGSKSSKPKGSGIVRVGDHMLVLGKVEEIIGGGEEGRSGLCYADGRYRRVGDVIEE
jgi:flavin reductase (DIM6/NTAB) family NADH-FMN oxidoreductase RutF